MSLRLKYWMHNRTKIHNSLKMIVPREKREIEKKNKRKSDLLILRRILFLLLSSFIFEQTILINIS